VAAKLNSDSVERLGEAKASSSATTYVFIGAGSAVALLLVSLVWFIFHRRAAQQKVIPSSAPGQSPKVQPEHLPTLAESQRDAVFKIHPEDINFDVSDDSDDSDEDSEGRPAHSVVKVLPVHPGDAMSASIDDRDNNDIELAHRI
jgi:hypothetical protein